MAQTQMTAVGHWLTSLPSRRDVWRGLASAGLGIAAAHNVGDLSAKKKKNKPRKQNAKGNLCTPNGQPCRKPGKKCKGTFCLKAPFTIEARWTVAADHDTYLFVPPAKDTTGPAPYIDYSCTRSAATPCDTAYPFACVSGDEQESGSEITTIFTLLPGAYEYWSELEDTTLAGELSVVLRDSSGRVVRTWQNPANPTPNQRGWHVFDIDGGAGSIRSVDTLVAGYVPDDTHEPSTFVCEFPGGVKAKARGARGVKRDDRP